MIIKEYITNKEACELIGISKTAMCKHFSKIRELNPQSVKIIGAVNRRDFEYYFNIGNAYRRGKKND